MIIDFEEKDHCYSVNGEIASISITELLAKHNLAPNYAGVKKEILEERANQGKIVHQDLEYILNKKNYTPTTEQGKNFKKWVENNLDCGVAEQRLALIYKKTLIIAGTADVMGLLKDGSYLVADHKNTSKFHREYVSWQVSLLDYFARKIGKEKINGKAINWKGATNFKCFHYDTKTGEMTPYELEKVDDVEIVKLLECEYSGTTYQRPVLVVEKDVIARFEQAEMAIVEIEKAYKEAEAIAKSMREEFCKLMGEQGIKTYITPNGLIKVNYIAASESFRVDSTKLRREYPLIYEKVVKPSTKKAYVTITKIDSLDKLIEER